MSTQQPPKKTIKKSLHKKTASFFAIFLTGLLCLMAILYSSPWGAQASISLINKLTNLSLTYKEGMFSETISFSTAQYNDEVVNINAKDLSLRFHLRCLWQKQMCINTLAIEHLNIKILSSEKNSPRKLFNMPIAIKAENLSVKRTDIYVNNHLIELKEISVSVDIKKHIFTFDNAVIHNALINTLAKHAQEPEVLFTKRKDIKLTNIHLPIKLNIHNLHVHSIVNNATQFNYLPSVSHNLQLSMNWFEHTLFVPLFKSNYSLGSINLNGNISFKDNYPLNIHVDNTLINNTYWPEINASKQIFTLSGDLSNLNISSTSKGALELAAKGNISLLNNNFPSNISLQVTKIPLYNQASQPIYPSELSLEIEGDIDTQFISLTSVVNGLGYNNAKVYFKGKHSKQTHQNIDNLKQTTAHKFSFEELNLNDTNNNIKASGFIVLGDKPAWNIKIDSSGFTFPTLKNTTSKLNTITQSPYDLINHIKAGEISGHIKGKVESIGVYNGIHSSISLKNTHLQGEINRIPFSLLGDIDLKENFTLKPSKFTLSIDDALLKIKGSSDKKWDIKGTLTTPEISKFTPKLFTYQLKGKLATQFTVSGANKNPIFNFTHQISDFTVDDLAVKSINITGSYSPFNQHEVNAQIASSNINGFDSELTDFLLNIDANINQQSVDLAWNGDYKTKLLLNSRWNPKTKHWLGVLAGAEINYLTHRWQPNSDIIIGYDHKAHSVSLNKHCWDNPGLQLCLKENISFFDTGNIPLFINLHSYYFNETFAPKDISLNTTMRGDVGIHWAPNSALRIDGDLSILAGNILLEPKENYLPVEVLSAWDQGRFTFNVNNQFINTHLKLGPDQINRANKVYDFYSDIDVKSQIAFNDEHTLSAQLTIDNFSLRPFQSMNHDLALLEGILTSKIDVKGNIGQPNVTGNLKLSDGRLKIIKSPNILENVQINVSLLNTKADINGTFNIDKDSGILRGDAQWLNEKILNLHVEAEKLSILLPPQIKATVSPKIDATLKRNHLKISGDVSVLDGIIRVVNLPEGSVELSNDVIFVDNQGIEIVKEKRFNIESDISVFINDTFQLTGKGFNGNLEGSLRVQQNNLKPLQIFGNLTIPGGRYHAYGQRLQIEKGKVAFNGPIANPHINIKATRTIPKENIKVGVEITGLANALSLNLVSTPALSRAQTLSYLLRGQGLENDTADNSGIGVALGAALANYSGILKQMDKLPLINNVEIEGDSSQVSVAGYLGKRIYLKYGIGVDEPINELTIRLFLMSRLWVETISGLENSADIYYSFDTNL